MNPRELCREPGYPSALLLTYDFDPLFFERIVLPDLWLGGSGDVLVVADRGRVDANVTRWEGQVRHLGRRYRLERSTGAGAFHATLLLRWGPQGALVAAGSGNVTSGGWGGNRELATAWAAGPGREEDGSWLADLLAGVAASVAGPDARRILAEAREVAWLRRAAPAPSTAPPVLLSLGERSLSSQLAARWRGRRFQRVRVLTGSTDEKGALLRWLHGAFGIAKAQVLVDENHCSFVEREIEALPFEARVVTDGAPRRLHAKLFWFEGPAGPAALVGSANCSAAAWLLSPAQKGNTELVAVFDAPDPGEFAALLEIFSSKDLSPVALRLKGEKRDEERGPGLAWPLAEVAFEPSRGELELAFAVPPPDDARVDVLAGEARWTCAPVDEARTAWVTAAGGLDELDGTRFVEVVVLRGSKELERQRHWVHDRAELLQASRGRRITETLQGLGRAQPPSERSRILRELHQIAQALIQEPASFPDPFQGRQARPRKATEEAAEAPAIDPEKLVRSLRELAPPRPTGASGALASLSLFGVLRGLFELETDAGDEGGDLDEELAEGDLAAGPEEPGPGNRPAQDASWRPAVERDRDQAEARDRGKLRRQMDEFLGHLRSEAFAQRCTATQLQQAAAYPLVVALQGLRGGWLERDETVLWAREVFDALFREATPDGHQGLIAAVWARYEKEGQREAVERMLGDGTLWFALLHALTVLPWASTEERFDRALAIRWVFQSRHLLASTDPGRMRHLVDAFERRHERARFLEEAPRTAARLRELEALLESAHAEAVDRQRREAILHREGNLIWHPKAGWGVVREEVTASVGSKMEAYLHLRADVRMVVAVGFYLNVTHEAARSPEIRQALDRALEA